jgi:hypothetical protein
LVAETVEEVKVVRVDVAVVALLATAKEARGAEILVGPTIAPKVLLLA